MLYKPGSKYKVLNTLGDEFVVKESNLPYKGDYIEMSDNTYFIGNEIKRLGDEIILKKDKPNNQGNTVSANKFNILKENYFKFISGTKTIVSTKNFPTKTDYIKGFFDRYFVKRNNEILSYKEIDKETYNALKNRKPDYDWHLYDYGKVLWVLSGEASRANTKTIEIAERNFKGVGILFPNTEEFYLPPSVITPQTSQKSSAENTKKPYIFNKTRESHPASDKEVKTPALEDVQKSMLNDIQLKHKNKQSQIKQKIQQIVDSETRLEKLRKNSISNNGGDSSNSRGGSSGGPSGGGGSSGGGGGGY
tara:strand:+ start:1387 stop:2304 length:918 start_codon:yes stop_codon:yes gene_type:complete